ncbi:MAG: hypothetical protein HOF69_03380 [Campylobacteraceae bacterium]|jgi:hypothetical protein|nr:hypothetical protein [Campylobacteraceae bacterium]MBT3882285.1 hypothetical protein [Campylobacteraceae bacterium]MBT4030309.1 hypothetical protein [Campylobacteraceae bacterium]MBT4179161.1 hypothetical protein [Campylobacteraceae bacterium]MBT4572357.1 hypothetical protein [Campylobacteraceae bacterium]
MDANELNEARTNPEFLEFLDTREKEAFENEDIAILYEVLDSLLILDLQEERVNKIYEKILTVSFDKIENRLKENKKLSLENEDIFYIRSFYEHSIEKWSCGNIEGAKELLFVLQNIIEDDRLQDSIAVHIVTCAKNISLDDFYDNKVLMNNEVDDEKHGYFIMNYKFDVKLFLEENSQIILDEHKKLKHLLD